MESQTERVVNLLRERGDCGLTPGEALREIGTMRLAARINDAKDPKLHLLKPDEEIVSERVSVGNGKVVARYTLRKRQPRGMTQDSLW